MCSQHMVGYQLVFVTSSLHSALHKRGMMHDEDIFHSPDVFQPERHLNLVLGDSDKKDTEKGPSVLKDNDPNNVIFGFGRR